MRAACSEKPSARAQRCLWLLRLVLLADAGQANRIGEVGVEMSILVIGAWGLVLLDFLLRNPSETPCESRANHLDCAVNREGAAGEKAVREDRMKRLRAPPALGPRDQFRRMKRPLMVVQTPM